MFKSRPEDAAAFVQDLRPLIAASRAEPGNEAYHMYTNPAQPGMVGFVERYANLAALQTHLSNDHVTSIFEHEYYAQVRDGDPQLFGPWKEVNPSSCNEEEEEMELVFYWTMNCPPKRVWDTITNWTDTSWVKDQPTATIVPLDEEGNVMTDEEAEMVGYVDPEGGLGPVVQRRTWADGTYVDVRMLSKDENTFTTVQQTLSALVFPEILFDKFFVTLTLDTAGLDSDTESRMRYHVRATVKTGTNDSARRMLKDDFYGSRIKFYQEYFNCSAGVQLKRAERSVANIHNALASADRATKIEPLFATQQGASDYLKRTIGTDALPINTTVNVYTPFPIFSTPDLRVVSVEDVVVSSTSGTSVLPRIVVYSMDAWGRVVSMRVFDSPADACVKPGKENASIMSSLMAKLSSIPSLVSAESLCEGEELVNATNLYFETLEKRDIEKVRELYAADAVLEDPVSFQPRRTFDSVYTNFYSLAESFEYTRYPARTFVDVESRQTAQVVDAVFQLANGGGELKANPVQVFSFNEQLKITKFEAFFRPSRIDFGSLE